MLKHPKEKNLWANMQGLTEVVKIGSIFEISQLSLRKNSKDNNAILL